MGEYPYKKIKSTEAYQKIANTISYLNSKYSIDIEVSLKRKSFNYSKEFLKELLIKLRECDLVSKDMDMYSLEETVLWHLMDYYAFQENQKIKKEDQDELESVWGNEWKNYIPNFTYQKLEDPIKYLILIFKRIKEENN